VLYRRELFFKDDDTHVFIETKNSVFIIKTINVFINFDDETRWSKSLPATGQINVTSIPYIKNFEFYTPYPKKSKPKIYNQIVLCFIFGIVDDELQIHKILHRSISNSLKASTIGGLKISVISGNSRLKEPPMVEVCDFDPIH
jgi:hypothetical protein